MFELHKSAQQGEAGQLGTVLSSRFTFYLLALLFVAASLRVGLFNEQLHTPLHMMHLWDESDMGFYDVWSDAIVDGDLLSARVGHPYVSPHKYVAHHLHETYQPELTFDDESAAQTWDDWFGGPRFHQAPLYPYVVSLSKWGGFGLKGVLAFQMLLGVASIGLLVFITRHLFGLETALLAGLLATFHGPFMFYEQLLLRTAPYTFVILLCVWMTLRCARGEVSAAFPLWTGFVYGVGILMKPTMLPVMLLAAGWLAWRNGNQGVRQALMCCAGAAVLLLPIVVRNVYLGVQPLGLSSVGAFGIAAALVPTQPGNGYVISPTVAEVMGAARGDGWATIKAVLASHDSPWDLLKLFWQRWLVFLVPAEIPNNVSYLYYRAGSRILGLAPVHWGLLIWPALVGLTLCIRRVRDTFPLVVVILMGITQLLAFFVLSRYRVPLTMALIPFAAWSYVLAVKHLLIQRRPALMLMLIAGMLAQPWVLERAGVQVSAEIRETDVEVSAAVWKYMADQKVAQRRFEDAFNTLNHALSYQRRVIESVPEKYNSLIRPWPRRLMQYKEEELAKYAEGLAEKINSPLLVKKYREMRIDPRLDASNL